MLNPNTDYHQPILVKEIIDFFDLQPNQKVIDATLGGGGHTEEILKHSVKVLGLDQDQEAIDYVTNNNPHPNLSIVRANFSELSQIAKEKNFIPADAILFDLGVSSHQFDADYRGFSVNKPAELDMRMDQNLAVKASDLVAVLNHKELTKLLSYYGGETKAHQIAKAIVEARNRAPITNTLQLARLVEKVYRSPHGRIHPATKTFQALRMAVNDEVNSLKLTLPQILEVLSPGGKIAIISFHDGEDRIVKHFLKQQADLNHLTNITKKPITPSSEEIQQNIRSRSAKLRLAIKN